VPHGASSVTSIVSGVDVVGSTASRRPSANLERSSVGELPTMYSVGCDGSRWNPSSQLAAPRPTGTTNVPSALPSPLRRSRPRGVGVYDVNAVVVKSCGTSTTAVSPTKCVAPEPTTFIDGPASGKVGASDGGDPSTGSMPVLLPPPHATQVASAIALFIT